MPELPVNPAGYIPPLKYPGHIFKLGSTDDEVKQIKLRLNGIHVPGVLKLLDINNPFFGNETEDVIKRFQKWKCLNADGEIGSLTWEKLFSPDAVLSFPPQVDSQSIAVRAMQHALTMRYVREKTGHNDGADVKEILKSVGLPEGYSWCQAFVYYNMQIAANQLGVTNPAPKTAGVLDHWAKVPNNHVADPKSPQTGDIGVMDFGKGAGHTFFVVKVIGDTVHTIEGNTAAQPTSAVQDRDGQGVFERIRKISSINKGFIRYK